MRCSHWTDYHATERTESGRTVVITDAQRCSREATCWLHGPDGQPVPGCRYCTEHAEACLTEYREKLHEEWSAPPIDAFGRLV